MLGRGILLGECRQAQGDRQCLGELTLIDVALGRCLVVPGECRSQFGMPEVGEHVAEGLEEIGEIGPGAFGVEVQRCGNDGSHGSKLAAVDPSSVVAWARSRSLEGTRSSGR